MKSDRKALSREPTQWWWTAIGLAALLGCTIPGDQEAPADPQPAPQAPAPAPEPVATAAAGKAVYKERCAACHGVNGRGDGPGAVALSPKPRDYTDKAWQKSVTDEQIKKTILLGGAGVGKSPNMPSSPDLDSKPETLDSLVKIVRDFGG